MNDHSKVLFVRHLPSVLSDVEKESLLKYFGADDVRVSRKTGNLKHTAFAEFPNATIAKQALLRLHQVKIYDSVLSVEYAKFPNSLTKQSVICDNEEVNIIDRQSVDQSQDKEKNFRYSDLLPPVAPHFGLKYPSNPGLKYKYPPPNQDILANISSALLTVPKLYYQVLHLMNKMHLMPPFTAQHMDPVQMKNICSVQHNGTDLPFEKEGNMEVMNTIDTSESESEYESGDSVDLTKSLDLGVPERITKLQKQWKRSAPSNNKPKLSVKYPKLSSSDSKVKRSTEIFDNYSSLEKKSFSLKLPAQIPPGLQPATLVDTEENPPSTSEVSTKDSDGFGKLNPVESKINSASTESQETGVSVLKDYITEAQLASGRLSSREMSSLPVFKNYKTGDPTCRLYVKNLSKRATGKDLEFIFGRFVNFEDQNEKNMFDVRLMTQGRMKGQAFIGMPSVEVANAALKSTNGYQLINKPMVVQFARSANPK